MYSPTTRLLTVLEMLQSYKQISGSEIARRLEVDKRTVRRYITMLQDMGIPVEGERGPYGSYQLQRGYKLPPLMFTDAEAVALTLSLLAIREYNFPVDVAAVEGALAKTERVMPEKLLRQARALKEAITFSISMPHMPTHTEFITRLSLSIQACQQVHLEYQAWDGTVTERAFDPYGIVFNDGFWYTAGYCHLRDGLRTFRMDRIVAIEPLDTSFERPADFDALDYVLKSVVMLSKPNQIEVILHTTLEKAQQTIPPVLGTLEPAENGIIFRRSSTQFEWVAHVLLNADFPVTIIEPDELRDVIRQIGLKALQMVGTASE